MTSMARRAGGAGLLLSAAWAGLYYQGRTWGSTREERARFLPGDELVEHPAILSNHAITIDAPPEKIWPWLIQMGWHRGGFYTYRWVDRLLFHDNDPSAERILDEYQDLKVGDHVPDGRPETGCYYVVEILEPNKMMVLRSWTHLPPQLRDNPRYRIEWTWAFYLDQVGEDETRLMFRMRGKLEPWWFTAMFQLLVVPADFVMARSMCLGLKRRAEQLIQ